MSLERRIERIEKALEVGKVRIRYRFPDYLLPYLPKPSAKDGEEERPAPDPVAGGAE